MAVLSLWPFQCPANHETVSAIISRRSTNTTDVRETVLRNLDLSFAKNILDLGCGFGFMAEALARRVAPGARLLGVDIWPANEGPFLNRVAANGRQASFTCLQVGSKLPWPDGSFDLVVCSYSLYFFLEVLPEVARVLAPRGLFLALTHSEDSFVGLLRATGLTFSESELLCLARRFSAENGRRHLQKWFGEVTRVDYHNCLRFQPEHLEELLTYVKFKMPLLVPGSQPGDDVPEHLERSAKASLFTLGHVIVEKDDAAFRCRSPLC